MRASTKFETFTIAIVPLLLWKKEGTNRDFLTDQYWSLRKKNSVSSRKNLLNYLSFSPSQAYSLVPEKGGKPVYTRLALRLSKI